MGKLTVSEIYASIQGEAAYAGYPCVFVRLTGCPLRCRWCDTAHSFAGGEEMSFDQIEEKINSFPIALVEFTGGEPLAQKQTPLLMQRLVDAGKKVLIETGGSEDISVVPKESHIIMDIKCPGSKMHEANRWDNIQHLKKSDEVKFVIADKADFEWALQIVQEFRLLERCTVLVSPAFGLIDPKQLAELVVASGIAVKMQLQIHKYIWSPRAKGV